MRALVVDDSALLRKILTELLTTQPDVEVIGACSGGIAVSRVAALKPDLVTLDMEMPDASGLEVLQGIRKLALGTGVIVVASRTARSAADAMRALELGAFEFLSKPDGGGADGRRVLGEHLATAVRAFRRRHEIQSMLHGSSHAAPVHPQAPRESLPATCEPAGVEKPSLVLIGSSTGGPQALTRVLSQLPERLGAAVLVVQHMPPIFTQALATSLNQKCALHVKEAEDGEAVLANAVYLAPGGRHMKVASGRQGEVTIRITDDPHENHCRPSVDYLFRSAALHFPGRALGVVLTGMGNDGALGVRLLKRSGSAIIAQDEATCVVFGMPKEAIATGAVDTTLPLGAIAGAIITRVLGRRC